MDWKQAVRYCGMNPKNPEAVRLCRKVRRKVKLNAVEVKRIFDIAEEISWVIGTENYILAIKDAGNKFPLTLTESSILYKDIYNRVVIGRKSDWLVEEVSDKVIGRFVKEGLEVFPNPYVLPEHLEAILSAPEDGSLAVN